MAEVREDNVYKAKLAEQAERYDGIINYYIYIKILFYFMLIDWVIYLLC